MTEFLDDNQLEQFRRKNMIWEVLEMVNKEENHLIQRSILAAVHNMQYVYSEFGPANKQA